MVQAFKWLFRGIWGFWGLLVFLITLIIVTPLYLVVLNFGGRFRQRQAHRLSRIWAKCLFKVILIRVKTYGHENLDPDKTYVMVSNHVSQLDIPAMTLATTHFFKFLAKEELTRVPFLGKIIRELYLTVNRSSLKGRMESMKTMHEALKSGTSVGIFPEGSRNRSSAPLQKFHDGAFLLSHKSGYPIAVLTIVGSGNCLPDDSKLQLNPGVIHCYWETILESDRKVEDLKEQAWNIMSKRLKTKAD